MPTDRDIRPCPVCGEPVDVTDWPAVEASACEGCGAALYLRYDDELTHISWEKVQF